MLRTPHRWTVAVAALAFAATLVFAAPSPAVAGTYYKAVTSVETSQGKNPEDYLVEAWIDGENAKVTFLSSPNPWAKAGTYVVTTDGGHTLYLVNPKEKTYSDWDIDGMVAMAGAVMESLGGVVKFDITDTQTERALDEPGPELLGMSTRHIRQTSSYNMKMKIMSMKRANQVSNTQDLWVTDRLQEPAFGVWLRKNPPKTGNDELDALIDAEMVKVDGTVLKSETVSRTVGGKKGREVVTRSVMEVTELREEDTSGVDYSVPEGYRPVEAMPSMP